MSMKQSRLKDTKIMTNVKEKRKKNPPFYTVKLNFQELTKDINT